MSSSNLTINNTLVTFTQVAETIFVPIKPVCEILGIDAKSQREMIQSHPIFSSFGVENPSVAADGKVREMLSLPLKYFFGWLMGIDARKVKPEAAEGVIAYQEKVYDVIYERFFLEPIQQKKKLVLLLEKEKELLMLENSRKEINSQIKVVREDIEVIKSTDASQLYLAL
jgi:P22_AR N-terminal domain